MKLLQINGGSGQLLIFSKKSQHLWKLNFLIQHSVKHISLLF